MDYKRIHETLGKEADWPILWAQRYEIGTGLWFAAGLVIGLILGAIL